MQFKHLAAKAKSSLFVVLLVVIGIGVFFMINTNDSDKNKESNKSSAEVNATDLEEENADNNPESNVPLQTDVPSKPSGDGKKNTTTYKPDFGTVDGGEYNNNFNGRVEVYENPFFGMKVNFPKGWTVADKLDYLLMLGEKFDASKYYLFTAFFSEKPLYLGVGAEKYPDGALKYLEGIKASKKYYTVSEIGSNGNQQTQKESKTTEISEVTINSNKFYQLSVTQVENESYLVYPWKNGVIVFKIVGPTELNGLQILKELLSGTTIGNPSLYEFTEIP